MIEAARPLLTHKCLGESRPDLRLLEIQFFQYFCGIYSSGGRLCRS